MDSRDIRESFLRFFEGKNHLRLKSASLVPKDNTLLFTAAGMVPLKSYFLQEEIPPSTRITTVQKCVRTNDIEQVGITKRHHTFFEMLGNFSIGDYFKEEAIAWAYEYIVNVLRLPFDKLWVSIYRDDDEAWGIWKKVGIKEEKIIRLGEEDNFWTMGPVGPCGPCSEIYFDRGAVTREEEKQLPGGDGERFLEIWNLVFTQFDRQPDGTLRPLPRKNIDTGMGLERITSVIENAESDFETDLFLPIIRRIEEVSEVNYGKDDKRDRAFKAIADHIRAITFLISDGVIPSNEKRGYVLRRLIRRSALFGRNIGLSKPFLYNISSAVAETLGDVYPEIVSSIPLVEKLLKDEEERFSSTLKVGFEFFNDRKELLLKNKVHEFPAEDVFYLYDTLGLPVELSEMLIHENGFVFDKEKFNALLEEQREKARGFYEGGEAFAERVFFVEVKNAVGETEFKGYETLFTRAKLKGIVKGSSMVDEASEGEEVALILNKTPFYPEKGGQVGDTGSITGENFVFEVSDTQTPIEGLIIHIGRLKKGKARVDEEVEAFVNEERRRSIMRAHTSTHLLQAALREMFGGTVSQQGSEVKPDEFRFDFSFSSSFQKTHLVEIEKRVNEIVMKCLPVKKTEMALEEAMKKGALAFFGEKYGNRVRVVEVKDVSSELCGGTHVDNTCEIGLVVLTSVKSVASGVKRIEALTGKKAYEFLTQRRLRMRKIEDILSISEEKVEARISELLEENRNLRKEVSDVKISILKEKVKKAEKLMEYENHPVYILEFEGLEFGELKRVYDLAKKEFKHGGIIIASKSRGETLLLLGSLSNEFPNEQIAEIIKEKFGVKGGGSQRLFQGSIEKEINLEDFKKTLGA